MKRAVCLLSGGLDSTVTVYYALQQGYEVAALTIDYGQLHNVEIEKAKITATELDLQHRILNISMPWGGSALTDNSIDVPKNRDLKDKSIPLTYVPARNTIFLSFAFSWAEVLGAEAVFIGANQIDYSGYPDCRLPYLQKIEEAFRLGTQAGVEGKHIKIEAPLIKMSKKDIVLLGTELNVPFENTWSCYQGGELPCGECDSCRIRDEAFMMANEILRSRSK